MESYKSSINIVDFQPDDPQLSRDMKKTGWKAWDLAPPTDPITKPNSENQ